MRPKSGRDFFALAVIGGLWGGAGAGVADAAVIGSTASQLPELDFARCATIGDALLGGQDPREMKNLAGSQLQRVQGMLAEIGGERAHAERMETGR